MKTARRVRGKNERRGPRNGGDEEQSLKNDGAQRHQGRWYTLPRMTTQSSPTTRDLLGVACTSATLLMTELALTRIFSVVMYYHFAFLAISIALFGLSASGVFAYVARRWLDRIPTGPLLARQAVLYAALTIVALFCLVRLRVGLNYSPENLVLMLTIYALATLPFFSGGLVVTLAISRMSARINAVYAADLLGAAAGCLMLIPLLDHLGAPGVVFAAAFLALVAAVLFSPSEGRAIIAGCGLVVLAGAAILGVTSGFDVTDTKGHEGDRVLFSKWNSFSRIGVYERTHGDWSLSPAYKGPLPDTRFMDIDSAASTPILHIDPTLSNAQYLRYELTALAYHLKEPQPGFYGARDRPGRRRDFVSALIFGAGRVDGVEINPIIADDVMRDRFREFSGGIYSHPRVRIAIDDGRSFVRRSPDRYDVIQASLVDTWAATAAGAYTLTENALHRRRVQRLPRSSHRQWRVDDHAVGLRRRAARLAGAGGGDARGWNAADRLAVIQQDRVATFLLKKSPFTPQEIATLRTVSDQLGFQVLYLRNRLASRVHRRRRKSGSRGRQRSTTRG